MGKFMRATVNVYSDVNYTTLLFSIPNYVIAIPVGNTTTVSRANIGEDFNYFASRLASGNIAYLGGTFLKDPLITIVPEKEPQLWFPLCTPKDNALWVNTDHTGGLPGTIELQFENGYKWRQNGKLYNNLNVQIGSINNVAYYAGVSTLSRVGEYDTGRASYSVLAASAMNSDGTVPTGTTFARYQLQGTFGADMYGKIDQLTAAQCADMVNFLNAIPAWVPATDPYAEVPPTAQGGGDKPYDPFDTDDVDYELLPEVSAVGTGFISLWCPTEQQMLNLSAYMWNADVTTLDFWKRLVADPIQLVYGLNIIPLDLRDKGIVGTDPEDVVVGAISTGIKMDYLTSQWVELDCGTIDIEESMLGSYLDYDPFTKVDIYLPYIGYRPLRIDDIMPGTIQLKYKIDLLTGSCVAQIKSTKSNLHDDTLNSIVYQFMGNCATQVPVTASQYADAVRSAISMAAAIGTIAALAGVGGSMAAVGGAEIMPAADPVGLLNGPSMVPVDSELGMSMANFASMSSTSQAGSVSGGMSSLRSAGIIHSAASAGSNVMGLKPSIERSGAIGGAAGMLATQMPYLIFTRPRLAHPEDQNKYTGYPSFMTENLSDLEGFTQIQAIHLEGLPCTASELAELDELLKSGVIF